LQQLTVKIRQAEPCSTLIVRAPLDRPLDFDDIHGSADLVLLTSDLRGSRWCL